MEMVKIYHPTLDDGRITEVPELSLEHWLRGGWLRESDRPKPEESKESESVPLVAEELEDTEDSKEDEK